MAEPADSLPQRPGRVVRFVRTGFFGLAALIVLEAVLVIACFWLLAAGQRTMHERVLPALAGAQELVQRVKRVEREARALTSMVEPFAVEAHVFAARLQTGELRQFLAQEATGWLDAPTHAEMIQLLDLWEDLLGRLTDLQLQRMQQRASLAEPASPRLRKIEFDLQHAAERLVLLDRLISLAEDHAQAAERAAQAQSEADSARLQQMTILVIVVLLVGIALALLLAWRANQRILFPLARLKNVMVGHVQGQRRTIPTQGDDEIADMARSFAHFVDAVDRREAELEQTIARLNATRARLVEAEKLASLGTLVAGVAHEINTPVGNALTTASTLEERTVAIQESARGGTLRRSELQAHLEDSVEMARLILRSCQRIAGVVRSFKQIAAEQEGGSQQVFDLRVVALEAVTQFGREPGRAPLAIEVEVPEGITCDSYPDSLLQVLLALLQNAAVHAFEPGQPGRIVILGESAGDEVMLSVADQGKGMSAAVLERVFEPFFTTHLGAGSSGLGLAICHNVVGRILGGELTATSTPGAGSRFTLRFPARAPKSPAASAPV